MRSFGAAGSRDLGHARFSGSPGRKQSVSPGTQHNIVSSWLRTVPAAQDRHTVGPQRRASGGIHVQTVGTFFLWEDHPERPTSITPCGGEAQGRPVEMQPPGCTGGWSRGHLCPAHTGTPGPPERGRRPAHTRRRKQAGYREAPRHLGNLSYWCRNSLEAVFPDTAQPSLQAGPSKSGSQGPPTRIPCSTA